jgi:hypothetical protein
VLDPVNEQVERDVAQFGSGRATQGRAMLYGNFGNGLCEVQSRIWCEEPDPADRRVEASFRSTVEG